MLYKDLTDEELIAAYWSTRKAISDWSRMAVPGQRRAYRSAVAGGFLRQSRNLDIIVAIGRKRGLTFTR